METKLSWKPIYYGTTLLWKPNYYGNQIIMETKLSWKPNYYENHSIMEPTHVIMATNYCGKQTIMEPNYHGPIIMEAHNIMTKYSSPVHFTPGWPPTCGNQFGEKNSANHNRARINPNY